MSDSFTNDDEGTGSMDDVGRLVRLAGAREAARPEGMEAARERVAAHWEQVVAGQQAGKQRKYRLISAAAGVAMAIVASLLFLTLTGAPQAPMVASVDRVLGELSVGDEVVAAGYAITPDSLIETGPQTRLALRMAGGQSLRVDSASRLVMHSPNSISLEFGTVYIDTESASNPLPIQILTPFGTAQDVGTQFQVRLSQNKLAVGVREGKVEVLQAGRDMLSIGRGRYLELATARAPVEGDLPHDDPSWHWAETVAPPFDIEGASLHAFLSWYVQQKGMQLVWADDDSMSKADSAELSGSIDGMTLTESLQLVQKISPFEYRIKDRSLWVRVD